MRLPHAPLSKVLQSDVPLAPLTTLDVGGAAGYFLAAQDVDEVVAALAWAKERRLQVAIIGGGSNLLVADRGFDGLVLRQRDTQLEHHIDGDHVDVQVSAGMNWDALVAWSVGQGFAGLECLSGIPGDVGAAPIQNVGAYGQEVAEVIRHVDVIDRETGERLTLDHQACAFAYRDSLFKSQQPDRYVVTSVRMSLRRCGAPTVRYPELERALERAGEQAEAGEPTLAAVRDTVIALRRGKSMVLDPDDENFRSAGSFFVNPIVDEATATRASEGAARLAPGETMPRYPSGGGRVKLSAAWLIERAGMAKGTVNGRVGISTRHSLALVNRGGATAHELVAFACEVKQRVVAAFGVSLTPEPRPLGFRPDELEALY
jgi:UDP-N-acetylmuramate dehydrogenase